MSSIDENDAVVHNGMREDPDQNTTIIVRTSKNNITLNQIIMACRHIPELLDAGVSENLAIRTLELFIDVYGKLYHGGSATPHHVDQVRLWSVAAMQEKQRFPGKPPKHYLRVEHGTPRRALAKLVLTTYRQGMLDQPMLDSLINRYWKLAVITLQEDEKLSSIARSKMFASPEERWEAAGIKFSAVEI